MRKSAMVNVLMVLFLFMGAHAWTYEIDYSKEYQLKIPEITMEARDVHSRIVLHKVRLSETGGDTFLVKPLSKEDLWATSLSEQTQKKGFEGRIVSADVVEISGYMGLGEVGAKVILSGHLIGNNVMKGTSVIQILAPDASVSTLEYRSQWALEEVDNKQPIEISNTVTYHGPPPKSFKATTSTPEERAKWPLQSDAGIKSMASYRVSLRNDLYKYASQDLKVFYNRILEELTWDEIRYTPGILLLIDHLASLEEADRGRIAKAYVRDGSVQFFDGISYGELQKTPPLFAILHAAGRMDQGEVEALRRESDLFDGMYRAYEQIPEDERAELSLHELMVEVSKNLPVNIRKQYFERSEKLQEYVASSRGDDLRPWYR